MKDFNLSKFLVCTDAGLGSFSNRNFNTEGERTYLEKTKLQDKFTTDEIISTLKNMLTNKIEGLGYKQLYQKTDITTALSNNYDFNLDQEFISTRNMKIF